MLQDQIDKAKRSVITDTLSFSVNEFVGMYEGGEINISPAFQRTFRWGIQQQSNLVESLLIGVPLPPVFVYENENGTWELVDGLQRSSTILKFFGVLRKPDSQEPEAPSALVSTKYLVGLENAVWKKSSMIEGLGVDSQNELTSAQQLFLKRCRLNVEVLKQPSDVNTKFDLFQRLNRGGSVANQQEVRTCAIVMRDPDFASDLNDLASEDKFIELCRISEDGMRRQTHVEYATRLLCHANYELRDREDLNEFLDDALVRIIESGDWQNMRAVFEGTVKLVYGAGGGEALLPPPGSRRIFTLRGLESVLVGIARNYEAITQEPDPNGFVASRLESFWRSEQARIFTSSGMRPGDRVSRTVPFGQRWFNPAIDNDQLSASD